MGMAFLLRRLMREGKAYAEAWREYREGRRTEKPQVNRALERLRLVYEGTVPVIVHSASAWGLGETVRLFHDEFGVELVVTHTSFGGFQAGPYAARRPTKVHINIGPRLIDQTTPPDGRLRNMASEYWKDGVRNLSINTDAIGVAYYGGGPPQEHLFYQASMAARHGLEEQAAIRAITLEPARALRIDDRLGSLKKGKDADLVLKRGALLDVTSPVDMVLIDGKIVFERPGHGITVTRRR
jgi:imidazolonepropionase-like amidohydrolase